MGSLYVLKEAAKQIVTRQHMIDGQRSHLGVQFLLIIFNNGGIAEEELGLIKPFRQDPHVLNFCCLVVI